MEKINLTFKLNGKQVTWNPKVPKILTKGTGNVKILKSEKTGKYKTMILHLAPAKSSGYEVCAGRSAGCTSGCLNFSGQGGMFYEKKGFHTCDIHVTRAGRTILFFKERALWFKIVKHELEVFLKRCKREKVTATCRMNGTSDLPWESIKDPATGKTIMELFPTIQFYDYTKVFSRLSKALPKNYFLTFSRSEVNEDEAFEALHKGFNVAVVFEKGLPETWHGFPVVNGDLTDLRFMDNKIFNISGPIVVGLKAKGRFAKRDTSGFVIRGATHDQIKMVA